ncbi:hypothetical protein ISS37_10825 [candidate division KSB1 bacterium]|nr:hypothetical protein [candidate division KSB1 bacterium]
MKGKIHHLATELKAHLPYTGFSVTSGLIMLGILTFIANLVTTKDFSIPSQGLFHVFHPIHILFSSIATTAMFWRHERKLIKSVIVGIVGAVLICGLSDIIIPYISGFLLGVKMHLHICIIEHPQIILPFVAAGVLIGLTMPTSIQTTIFSHSAHVLVSSMASILYLVSFGMVEWIHQIGAVFIYMTLAVIIPCCTSDIIFPILITKEETT